MCLPPKPKPGEGAGTTGPSGGGTVPHTTQAGGSSSSSSSSTSSVSSSSTSISSSSGSSVTTGLRRLSAAPPSSTTSATLRLRGSNTSSIASRFGGNAVVFPKLGVGGGASPFVSSNTTTSTLRKFNNLGSSSRVEFATVKLKKVSKYSEDSRSKLNDVNSGSAISTENKDALTKKWKEKSNDLVHKLTETISKTKLESENYTEISKSNNSNKLMQTSSKVATSVTSNDTVSISGDSAQIIESSQSSQSAECLRPTETSSKSTDSSKVKEISIKLTGSTNLTTPSKSIDSVKASEISSKSNDSVTQLASTDNTKEASNTGSTSIVSSKTSSSSTLKNSSESNRSHSSESAHVSSVSMKQSLSSVVNDSECSSSSSNVNISQSILTLSTNSLSRCSTIKSNNIPSIATYPEDGKGDTEIKVTTTVKKVKKSADGVVKKKKKKAVGTDVREIQIIPETVSEYNTDETTDVKKKSTLDREIEIKVITKEKTEKEVEKLETTKAIDSKTYLTTPDVEKAKKEVETSGKTKSSESKTNITTPDVEKSQKEINKPVTTNANESETNISTPDNKASETDRNKPKCVGLESEVKSLAEKSATISNTTNASAPHVTTLPAAAAIMTKKTMSASSPGVLHPAGPIAAAASPTSPSAAPSARGGASPNTSCDAVTNISDAASINAVNSTLAAMTLDGSEGKRSSPPEQAADKLLPSSFNTSSSVSASTAPISIPYAAAVSSSATITIPSLLSSSPSVCSLSTATDTLSTSISTSASDLSSSPPPPPTINSVDVAPPSLATTACSTFVMASTLSTTTLSTSANLPASCVTTATSSSSAGASSYLGLYNTSAASDESIHIIVRDMSSVSRCINRTSLYAPASSTIGALLVEIGQKFGYEPDTFSLTFQNSAALDPVDLERQNPSKCLTELSFIADGVSRNSLLLSDLCSSPPKRTHSNDGSGKDDDLALGASASPTSCGEDSGAYSSSSATAGSRKKQSWQELDTFASTISTSTGAGTSSAGAGTTSSSHEYTSYTYGAGGSGKQDTGYVGLVNQAMTCYLNSLLQTLYMTPEFRNALYRWEFKGSKEEGFKSIPFQLQKLFLLLQTADRSAVETTKLTKSFGWDSSEAWQQHDIQELCRVMFEALEQSFANTDQANLIDTLYQGKMKDYVKCLACDKENARMDSFLDIPLPIRPFGSSSAYQSLEEALKAFVTPELLSGSNQYQCSNCDAMCDAHKGLKFTKYPYLLTIHLKRFDFDYQTFHRIKLNDRVTFPNKLDLSEFLDDRDISGMVSSGGGCSSSNKSDSAASALDDAATDDSGSALDNEDSLVDFTPPHNTTQDEDEGIELSASDSERNNTTTTDKKMVKKTRKSVGGCVNGHATVNGSNNGTSTIDSSASAEIGQKSVITVPKETYIESNLAKSDEAICPTEEQAEASEEVCTTYQLFSIMIHSGSASGGHYYAYIKDFVTQDWFCFNDQSVTKISDDDIRRTYGSGTRGGGGSSGWTASANAYMLMYRQCNERVNVMPFVPDTFPAHITSLCTSLNEEEEQEKEARERERRTCIIKLFCNHPATGHLSDLKLRINKDDTLEDATKQAHQLLELDKVVPLERCRLVKYEEYHDSLESSFEGLENTAMSEVLGGVKSTYKFDLLMEVREETQSFEVYHPGGLSVKVFVVVLSECGEVEGPHIVRGSQTMTVAELKQAIGRSLSLNSQVMRIVVEGFYNEMKLLADDAAQLRNEGFYRSHKVFVEASDTENSTYYVGSQMAGVIDRYQNTITLYCNLPQVTPEILAELNIPPYTEEAVTPSQQLKQETSLAESKSSGTSSSVSPLPPAAASSVTTTTPKQNLTLPVPSSSIITTPSTSSLLPPSSLSSATSSSATVVSSSLLSSATPSSSSLVSSADALSSLKTTCDNTNAASSSSNSTCSIVGHNEPSVTTPAPTTSSDSQPASSVTTTSGNVSASSTGAVVNETTGTVAAGSGAGVSAGSGVGGGNLSDGDDDEGGDVCGGGYSTLSSDQSTSEDSSLTSDSDRTLVGEPPEEDRLSDHSPDYHNVSSPEDEGESSSKVMLEGWPNSCSSNVGAVVGRDIWGDRGAGADDPPPVRRYFKAKILAGSDNPDDRVVEMRVDKRMTVDQLKAEMQSVLGVSVEHFKLYKKYIQEFECSRGSEQVKSFGESGRLVAKLDRALLQGEFRGKLYLLDTTNLLEPFKFLLDWVLRVNETVALARAAIVKEVNARCKLNLTADRLRLRKKSWKNPQTVYLDNYVMGEDIHLYNNWEMFLQALPGPEPKTDSIDEMVVFVRRWRPSQYTMDSVTELLLPEATAEHLREKLAVVSEVPVERVEFAKGRNTFPCDISVLKIHTELDWTRRDGPLDARPLGILDDGALVYYRDKEEELKELTESERTDLDTEENQRLNRDTIYSTPVVAVSKPAREKGLKIYFNTD